jgi:hypothetical protein
MADYAVRLDGVQSMVMVAMLGATAGDALAGNGGDALAGK